MESYEVLWNTALPTIENSVSSITFETYIKQLVPVDFIAGKLVLITDSKLFADTILKRENLKISLLRALQESSSGITDFDILVFSSKEEYYKDRENGNDFPVENNGSPINPKFTFENFVVGPSNEFIFAAAKAVAEAPGEAYNPLFIYGGTGLGKTHILMAIANHIRLKSPHTNVLYATCEQFTNQMIESLSKGKVSPQDFRNKFRNVDVLLIDDVQFLANKQGVQTEFFHTFNELIMQEKQIVLVSDRPPKEIDLLEDRLRTRFEGGLLADVQIPDVETKIAILRRKAEEKKTFVDIKVLTYIAEMGDNDVRSLIGKLTKVIFASKLHEKPITRELVDEALKESSAETPDALSAEDIISCVCDFYKVNKSDVVGKKKNKEFVEPRQICMYLMTELLSLPLLTVGDKLGGRDHSTVIYSRDKIAEQIKSDNKLSVEINDIRNMLLRK